MILKVDTILLPIKCLHDRHYIPVCITVSADCHSALLYEDV